MPEGLAIAIAVLIFVVVTIAKGVRLVAQGEEWVVERLGKYHATLRPGSTSSSRIWIGSPTSW